MMWSAPHGLVLCTPSFEGKPPAVVALLRLNLLWRETHVETILRCVCQDLRACSATPKRELFVHQEAAVSSSPCSELFFFEHQAYSILFGTEDGDAAESDEEQQKIETRNGLREKLRDAFRSIQVWCLPSPHAQIDGEAVSKNG